MKTKETYFSLKTISSLLLPAILLIAVAGCSDGTNQTPDGFNGQDADQDAAWDAGSDSGADAGIDAQTEDGADSGDESADQGSDEQA